MELLTKFNFVLAIFPHLSVVYSDKDTAGPAAVAMWTIQGPPAGLVTVLQEEQRKITLVICYDYSQIRLKCCLKFCNLILVWIFKQM